MYVSGPDGCIFVRFIFLTFSILGKNKQKTNLIWQYNAR